MINVAILGCTGSIGRQTVNVVRRYPDLFRITSLVCGSDADILLSLANEFKPSFIGIADRSKIDKLKAGLTYRCELVGGDEAQIIAASRAETDVVVGAVVGLNGLRGVVAGIYAGKKIALANKETLVACGRFVTELAKKKNVSILPVDSEHCAIFQCLECGKREDVSRIILTASGGPFRKAESRAELERITPEQAVKHPNWTMGKKISVDSATMMNKGLEIIEARWLFDCENIDYIIQPDSMIHSMVEYNDGSIIAQMAKPNMELPIQYALTYPKRLDCGLGKFDFTKDICFVEPNEELFPMPVYAKQALKAGGTAPAILNATNEAAVKLFLDGEIAFTDIFSLVEHMLNIEPSVEYFDYEEIIELHERIYGVTLKNYRKILEK